MLYFGSLSRRKTETTSNKKEQREALSPNIVQYIRAASLSPQIAVSAAILPHVRDFPALKTFDSLVIVLVPLLPRRRCLSVWNRYM